MVSIPAIAVRPTVRGTQQLICRVIDIDDYHKGNVEAEMSVEPTFGSSPQFNEPANASAGSLNKGPRLEFRQASFYCV
jgi:hypothetical protein